MNMRLKILYDNESEDGFVNGWGFSCLVETGNRKIMFDTGWDGNILLYNMERFGITKEDIDTIVISHDHWDHMGGLTHILHPNVKVYVPNSFSRQLKNEISQKADVAGTTRLEKIGPDVYTTGEIIGIYKDEPISEQVLICKTDKGLSVVTGCAHPGIVSIVDKAVNLFPNQILNTLMGGFHLSKISKKEVEEVFGKLNEYGFKNYGGTHCTGDFARQFNTFDIAAGSRIEL